MHNISTRGQGKLENLLSRKRAEVAIAKLSGLAKRRRILDVGCGAVPKLLGLIDFEEKYGIDPSLQSTEIPGIHLIRQSFALGRLPFEDAFFDAVSALAVAEHLHQKDDQALFAEIFRVLAPGGRIILTTPTPWTDQLLRLLARVGLVSKEEIDEHKSLLPLRMMKEMLIKAGFEDGGISLGYFELGMNQWIMANK